MKKINLGDWSVALVVVICSVILFLALIFALTGTILGKPARTVRAQFQDITGINISANVKFAGALAGKVTKIRMLTLDERKASRDPRNAIELTLALTKEVPELPSDISVSIAADTLLSDKLIVISGGSPTAAPLADNAVVQGITPVTFDKLVRDVDGVVDGLDGLLSGASEGVTGDIFDRLRDLLTKVEGILAQAQPVVTDVGVLMKDAQPVVKNAGLLMSDARHLIETNAQPITQAVTTLNKAAVSFEQLASRSTNLLNAHQKNINTTLADFKVTMENLKITSTYTRFLTRNLALRPQQLLWGNAKPPALPSEQSILRSAKPVDLQ